MIVKGRDVRGWKKNWHFLKETILQRELYGIRKIKLEEGGVNDGATK